ncbi:MAG: hypothetical protein J7L86_05625, partial [Candidatus Marinimicrobia bacterium]|nr:hypothetical protein [Candidatus Neomarinimicrobiota bacterium]
KSKNHVILNEVRMKNLSQLSTRFFVAPLPQNDSFGPFYETIKLDFESKLFQNIIKMICYRAESSFSILLSSNYRKKMTEMRALSKSLLFIMYLDCF